MQVSEQNLRELLINPGHISKEDFDAAVIQAKKDKVSLGHYLVDKGLISDNNLGQVIADFFDYHFVNFKKIKINEKVIHFIPEVVARSRGLVVFEKKDKLKVAMLNPDDLEMKRFLEKKSGLPLKVYYTTEISLNAALAEYHNSAFQALNEFFNNFKKNCNSKTEKENGIINLVYMILQYAYLSGTSDIHFDPLNDGAILRYRIDGILHDIIKIDSAFSSYIISRVKILAKMRTDEHRAGQDGKLSFMVSKFGFEGSKSARKKIDVRVSIVPTAHGENLVMRLLTADKNALTLDNLGFSPTDAQKILKASRSSVGMILVTGPTGSGKTTTLYGVLKILNKREVNIATIEDPIEYSIDGITQIQVNRKANITFSNGLRSLLRQDPNIIMVGEIRDNETADIAINAAMTGHLVLSTLHTNNAVTTIPRLLDMGIEPFLVTSTVKVALAQRLVRKVCENCRVSYMLTDEEKAILKTQPKILKSVLKRCGGKLANVRLYHGLGCKACNNTGYSGRIGIFEILTMSPEIKKAILKHASSDEITKIAISQGMTKMVDDGLDKAFQGVTTIEEVLRVASGE